MTRSTGTGSAMHVDLARIVIQRGAGPGAPERLSTSDIPEIRRLLRTPMPLSEIAERFGVVPRTLATFIKRRQICNLVDRRNFILLQRSLDRAAAKDSRG